MAARITTSVDEAAAAIRAGRLAAFATETVYGLGANALSADACARIFDAKGRPSFDPLIVHVADRSAVFELASQIPDVARRLIDRFWPGPLTLVLPKRSLVPDIVTAGLDTVGIRMPAHPQARELIAAAGCPISAPSANLFGHISPTTAGHVAEQLGDRIDVILDGGPCTVGVESTVLDVSGPKPMLLRPGGIPLEEIEELTGPLSITATIVDGHAAPGPGMLARHYSPRTPLRLWRQEDAVPSGRIGLLSWRQREPDPRFALIENLSSSGDLREAAANLFSAMRRLDAAGLELILATLLPDHGLGRAINDRLRRAATP